MAEAVRGPKPSRCRLFMRRIDLLAAAGVTEIAGCASTSSSLAPWPGRVMTMMTSGLALMTASSVIGL